MTTTNNLWLRMLKWVFSTPWATCIFLALIGTIGVALLLRGSPLFSISRVATGTIFGLAVGLAYAVDSRNNCSPNAKRLINGLIGIFSGLAIAFLLGLGNIGLIAAAIIGLALGVTAKEWVYHISII